MRFVAWRRRIHARHGHNAIYFVCFLNTAFTGIILLARRSMRELIKSRPALIKPMALAVPGRQRHLSHLGFEPLGKWRKGFANGKGVRPAERARDDKIRQQLQVGFLFARICVCRLTQMPDAKRLRDKPRSEIVNPRRFRRLAVAVNHVPLRVIALK